MRVDTGWKVKAENVRIGELNKRTGVNARLLRYYEAQGLLTSTRAPNGYRDYDSSAPTTVRQIRALLQAGLSTRDIRELLPCATTEVAVLVPCAEVLDLLTARLRVLDERLAALNGARSLLARYVGAAENSAPAG